MKKIIESLQGKEFTAEEWNQLMDVLYETNPMKHNPVSRVRFIDIDRIQPNDYNPNAVAKQEMKLLYTSIKHDGYTQPTVAVYDEEIDKYVIVDGFHRYYVMKSYQDIFDLNGGRLPIVVIDKDINDRMASTVRHNRARGKHSLTGMGTIVMEMVNNGATDAEICNNLGLEPDELVRLKHTTGVAKLFESSSYSQAHKPARQIEVEYDPTQPGSVPQENPNFDSVIPPDEWSE